MSETNKKSPSVKNNPDQKAALAHFPSNEKVLAEHADAIRALDKQAGATVVDIGRRLIEAKALVGHGNWLPWLEREFRWTAETALRFMQVTEAVGKNNLDIGVSSLYLLAAPSTPPEAVEAVIDRAKTGEKVTGDEVKKVVHEAKSKSSPRPPDSGTKKRGGEETKRHDERMKSARYKLEAFIRDYFDMAEWKELCEAITKQLGAKHV
jgi:intein/homing endonuclease